MILRTAGKIGSLEPRAKSYGILGSLWVHKVQKKADLIFWTELKF